MHMRSHMDTDNIVMSLQWINPASTLSWKKLFQYPAHFPQLWLCSLPPRIILLPPDDQAGLCWTPIHPLSHYYLPSYVLLRLPHIHSSSIAFHFYTRPELIFMFNPLTSSNYLIREECRLPMYICLLLCSSCLVSEQVYITTDFWPLVLRPSVQHIQSRVCLHISPKILVYRDKHTLHLNIWHEVRFSNSVHT